MAEEQAAGQRAAVSVPRGAYVGASVLAVILGAAGIVRGTSLLAGAQDSDLTTFFFPAADQILRGNLWGIYAVRAFGGYPNYNPPISIFLMAPLLALARALGLGANLGALITFVSIPFIAFALTLGFVTVAALRRLYPTISDTQRFLAFILIVFGPLTWQTFFTWYHVEQPLMLTLLVGAFVAFQARREGLAGLLAGLAVLSRTTALIPLIAIGVLLLAEREWRPLAKFGGIAAGVTALGLAPFFLFDRANATYSLLKWRGGAEIGGNSIWSLFKYDGTEAAAPLRYALDHFARRLDMYTVIVVVAIVAFVAARRLRISAYGRDAWAVLAIAALAVPMLSKNNWPYYYLEPFVFLLIWEFASMHDRRSGVWRWPVLTFGYLSVAATLSQFIGLRSVGALDRIVVGLLDFGAMLAFAIAVWMRAGAAREESPVAMQGWPARASGIGARGPGGAPSRGAPPRTPGTAGSPQQAQQTQQAWPSAIQGAGQPVRSGAPPPYAPGQPPGWPAPSGPPPAAPKAPSNQPGAWGGSGGLAGPHEPGPRQWPAGPAAPPPAAPPSPWGGR